ncbi:MAG: hypothetical protein DRN04_06530 [Thermoprotei archaeon]|nr:MAG: hypothetical protein DRN04_06530 [Thermoprotei archaeon]
MTKTLRDLERRNSDIEASALVSSDGLVIASALPSEVDEAKVAAMTAAIQSVAERVAAELGRGRNVMTYIEGTEGGILITNVTEDVLLSVVLRPGAKLGLALFDAKSYAKRLRDILLGGE